MTKKENILRAIKRDNPKWVPYRYDGSLTLIKPILNLQPPEGGIDDWGVKWIPTYTIEGSYPEEKPVITIDMIDKFKLPGTNWLKITENLKKQIQLKVKEDTLFIVYNNFPLYDRARLLLGTTDFLIYTITEYEKINVFLDKIMDYQIKLTEAIMKSGAEGIRFCEDWGTQRAMIFSPEIWRKLLKPRLKILYQIVKNYNGIVFQHSCGHIEEIVLDLIEIGMDVLDPCQPSSNNIFKWKEKYGNKLSFMGGLNTQSYLSFDTPEVVKSIVKSVVSIMARNGGYIAAPSHSISFPEDNRKAMIEAIDEINQLA